MCGERGSVLSGWPLFLRCPNTGCCGRASFSVLWPGLIAGAVEDDARCGSKLLDFRFSTGARTSSAHAEKRDILAVLCDKVSTGHTGGAPASRMPPSCAGLPTRTRPPADTHTRARSMGRSGDRPSFDGSTAFRIPHHQTYHLDSPGWMTRLEMRAAMTRFWHDVCRTDSENFADYASSA